MVTDDPGAPGDSPRTLNGANRQLADSSAAA
jgi:hypothetical protein